jgi:hypothetical protein
MADDGNTNDVGGYGRGTQEPSPSLRALDKLVGTWELSGDVGGTVTYEWMEGGFFLIQHIDLGEEAKGMEIMSALGSWDRSRAQTSRAASTATPATPSTTPTNSKETPSRSGSGTGDRPPTTRAP